MSIPAIGLLVGGLALLVLGGNALVRGASELARVAGLSPLVIGLTVVAFGTSAPELATSTAAALRGQGDIALGNVVGSNIFNVLLILGASAVITPLVVAQRLVFVDVPIMIGLSVAVFAFGNDGRIGRGDALSLLAVLAGYVAYSIRTAKAEPPEVRSEYEREYGAAGRQPVGGRAASLGFVLAGLVLLVWGSRWFVEGASELPKPIDEIRAVTDRLLGG